MPGRGVNTPPGLQLLGRGTKDLVETHKQLRLVHALPFIRLLKPMGTPEPVCADWTLQGRNAIKKHRKKLKIKAFRVGSGKKEEVSIHFETLDFELL